MEPIKQDEKMAELVEKYGELEVEAAEDPFQRLVISIINQQLSTASAKAIKERVFDRFNVTPKDMLAADKEEMKETGLSQQKVDYIKSAAEQFIEDNLGPEKFEEMSDEEVIEELTEIHGVGVWTAKMFMMFVLGREDIFATEDLGIREGMKQLYDVETKQEMREKAEEWRPYRTVACLYIWEYYEN